jgi:hypothetical protein
MAGWSGHTAGLVVLSRTIKERGSAIADEGMAAFATLGDQDSTLSPMLLIPPLGTCTAYTGAIASGPQPAPFTGDALMPSAHAGGRDAGPRITVVRGKMRVAISPVPGATGMYRRLLGEQRGGRPGRLGPLFLEPGNLVVAGLGGADVGSFAVSVPAPEPFVWENRDSLGTVTRSNGVTLRWHPLPQEGVMLIGLTSVDPSMSAWGACYCAAPGAGGSFTIPPAVLANLPAGQEGPTVPAPSLILSYAPLQSRQPLHAKGLDNGLAISLFVQALDVHMR